MRLNVPYIRQTGPNDCWHAAAQMIFAYRGASIDPLNSVYQADAGLSPDCASIAALAKATGMSTLPISPSSYTGPQLQTMLGTYGPLWMPLQGMGAHVMVITGVEGNKVYLNDPGGQPNGKYPYEEKKERDIAWFSQYLDRSVGLMYLP